MLALPSSAWSTTPVLRDTPVHISADQFHLDQKTGISTYTGHVRVTQNRLIIDGKRLTVIAPAKGPVTQLSIDGAPARFSDTTSKGKPVSGHALRMLYLPRDQQIQLNGKAELIQGRNTFSSAHIVYDTQNGAVTAGAPGNRVEATLTPNKTVDHSKGKPAP